MRTSVFFLGVALLCLGAPALAQERGTVVEHGHQLFFTHGCYGCHTVGPMGTPIGPDLSQVGAHYSPAYLTGWLRDPASQKRTAHMPKLDLTEAEIQALAAYLASLR